MTNVLCTNKILFFFFSFRPFPLIRGSHSISSFSKPCVGLLAPTSLILSFTKFKNLLLGLSLYLLFGNSIFIIFLPTYCLSLLMTCPYHLSLSSFIFILNRSILTVRLMYSFLILSDVIGSKLLSLLS